MTVSYTVIEDFVSQADDGLSLRKGQQVQVSEDFKNIASWLKNKLKCHEFEQFISKTNVGTRASLSVQILSFSFCEIIGQCTHFISWRPAKSWIRH